MKSVPPAELALSVIIPALDEQSQIARALASTRLPGVERIVVDGGSRDGTVATSRFLRAEKVIRSLAGRAHQLDAGWREARAPIVLFLHADTRLESGWLEAVCGALADPGIAGGAFRLRIEAPGLRYRAVAHGLAWRARITGLPNGEQALFLRRDVLARAGGVPLVPIFEDLDVARLIRAAGRLITLPQRAWASAQRYQSRGVVRQALRDHAALAQYWLNVEREEIARWYRRRPAA